MFRIEIRAMHGGVATGAPATAEFQFVGVVFIADQDLPGADQRALRLRVALEAKIVVALDEHLGVDRTMRAVADDAAFPHRFVLEDEGLALVAMALGAGLVEAGQGEAAGGFHDVRAVRVVALDAIHFAFEHGMMLREAELGVGFQVAIQTARRVFAGIENEFPASTANRNVLAAGAVTGFATTRAGGGARHEVHPRVGAGGELSHVVGVAGQAGLVADEMRSGDFGRDDDIAGNGGAGIETDDQRRQECRDECRGAPATPYSNLLGLR